jgi:hypothetical protein
MKYNGGQAFPSREYKGMTLRDYFAGQALAGEIIATLPTNDREACALAGLCYRIADAMLAERAKE